MMASINQERYSAHAIDPATNYRRPPSRFVHPAIACRGAAGDGRTARRDAGGLRPSRAASGAGDAHPVLGHRANPAVGPRGRIGARVAAEHAFRWNVKGWVANDGGAQPNSPGLDGLKICGEQLMPAAAVAAMSARIGDGMSTWNTGVISAANAPASDKGIRIGMTAKEALRLMVA